MTDCRTSFCLVVRWSRRWIVCVAMFGLLAPAASSATMLAEPDARAVRKVVQAQLDAFAAGDAERAFSYASTSIRAQFGDANRFMAMVRVGYPMVVRPATVAFFQAQFEGRVTGAADLAGAQTTVRQAVQLRDREGRLWMATYLLERQAGTGWRIGGCMLVADSGKSLT